MLRRRVVEHHGVLLDRDGGPLLCTEVVFDDSGVVVGVGLLDSPDFE